MKIIGKHKSEVIKQSLRKMRLFVWTTAPIMTAASIVCIVCNILIRNIFIPLFVFCALFVLIELIFLRSTKKQTLDRDAKRDQSTYRYEEIEFAENAISLKSFSYYTSGDYLIPYENIKKICFTKNSIYIYFLKLVWGFSRADMLDAEEAELITLLKDKLSIEKFNPAKIPERKTAGCQEQPLIPEKEVINLFPVTSGSHNPSTDDLKFASGFNHKNGQRTNFKKSCVIAGIIALCLLILGIISLILHNGGLFTFSMTLFSFAILFFGIFGLSLLFVKKAIEWSKQIAVTRITISDYFTEWETVYRDGTVAKAAYNFISFTAISETRDYFIFNLSNANIAVPKSAFENLDIPRQIFIKELGAKYKYFPNK